jgi:DNA-directed RNA polymerase subunit RPC12/RpoP
MSETSTNNRPVTCPQCGAEVALPGYAELAVCPYCGANLKRERLLAADEWGPLHREMEEEGTSIPEFPVAGTAGGTLAGGTLAGATLAGAAPAAATPTPGAAAEPTEQALHSLMCPQCAGPLSVRAGRRILLCSHCGVRVLMCGQGGVSRWLFPQTTDHVHALGTAAKWLTTYPGISQKAREVPVRQARLFHIPIWEHKVLVAGWEFGTKLRTKTFLAGDDEGNEHLELALTEERFEDPHLQERRYFQAACDLTALEATRPRFSGRELLLPLVAGEIDPASLVVEAQGTAAEIAEHGRKIALQPASGAADPQTRMLILRESVSLLYYPLWLVDYQVGGRPYRVVVDAHEGSVNSATAPAREGRCTPELGFKVAGLVVVAILALWFGWAWASIRMPTIFLAVIVCVAAVLLVLRSPAGGKVEYHDSFSS